MHRIRVRYNECDGQDVVFNGNYLIYLDVTLTELLRQVAGSYAQLIDSGVDLMLVQSNLSYRAPAHADDEVDVAMEVVRLGNTSIEITAEIRRDADLLLAAELHYVLIDPGPQTKLEIPASLRALLLPAQA